MRLRLVHTLSLLLISAVLVAVLSMGAVMAWNLKNGFADYLQARDAEQLEKFAALVADAAEQAGGVAEIRQRGTTLRDLLDQFAQAQGLPRRRPAGPIEGAARGGGDATPKRAPPPGGLDGFGPRVTVLNVDGSPIFDRPTPTSPDGFIDRPIKVRGEVVALARLRKTAQVPDAVEARFLQKQYIGIFAVSSLLVALALASAWWLARRWVRPLQAAQDATARIARGEFGVRVDSHTEVKRSDEIGDLLRNINRMAGGLQRLESSRRRWLADISHELRTPLAGLRGDIEALVDGVRTLKHESVVSLRDKALQLSALVDDLHLLAMSDLKALPCQFLEVDAVALMRQAAKRFERRAASGLALGLELNGLKELLVCWDKMRIDQLLDNLMENSFRYTDAPGRVTLALKRAGNKVLISIDDSAPTVAESDMPHLFEPLYRADTARSRHRGGSGLGLAICDAIVRSHDGHIEAKQSTLGGLCVRIELPMSAGVQG